jgi:hypothetical protein
LISRAAEVDVDGAGNVKIYCSESLIGKIDGMGNIIYYGNPTVQKTINGLGTISAG